MKILAVTSFAADMISSGERLVQSCERRLDADLLICYEEPDPASIHGSPRATLFNLRQSSVLSKWLAANRDIIPRELDGLAEPCRCPATSAFEGHAEGCHWFWFNRNASRWFRKVAAMEIAAGRTGYDAILWLDADCRIKRKIPPGKFNEWFGDASVLYLKSRQRRSIESGVLGIRLDAHGRRFLALTLARYVSGEFRRFERWDDGFQFQVTLSQNPDIPAVDLAQGVTGGSFVLPNSPLAPFIGHDKGIHRRSGVMR